MIANQNINNQYQNSDVWLVSAANRYTGAWNELQSRLRSRQVTRITFITFSWVILGITLQISSIGSSGINDLAKIYICLLVIIVQFISLVFSLWSAYDDTIIGILSAICQTLEKSQNSNNIERDKVTPLPGYHTLEQNWLHLARTVRIFFDLAMYVIIIINCIVGWLIVSNIDFLNNWCLKGLIEGTIVIISLISCCIIKYASFIRKLLRDKYSWDNGEFKKI